MYLGAARTEKGFTLLPDLVSSVFEHRPILDVHFHIQVTPQILGYTRDVGVAVSQLRKLGSPRLTLIEEPLSREAYHSTLEKADVLLLMYHPDRYRVRSSGIAVESIISASTIIASKGTFPAELAGCAGIGLDYGESAVNAISAIIRDRDTYRRLAEERRCWYLDNFNARAFVDRLLSPRHRWQPALTTPSTPLRDSTVWKRLL
jgi:glycosyltransferase involved in cell wall biosynthesis